MYTVLDAYGVSATPNSPWKALDILEMELEDIYANYRKVYVTLQPNFQVDPLYVDMDIFRSSYVDFIDNVSSPVDATPLEIFFDNLGSDAFETVDEIPGKRLARAYFADAFSSGYQIDMIGRNTSLDADIPRDQKTDLVVSRKLKNTNMADVNKYCLFSVNGFYHFDETDGEYSYVHDGGKSCLMSRQNTIGLYSFYNIGEIKKIPLTSEMVTGAVGTSLRERAFIQLDEDTTDKTVLLVIGGYLILPTTGLLTKTGTDLFTLQMDKISLLDRYFESRRFIDYSSLGLDLNDTNDALINANQINEAAQVRAYLTLSQSFAVVIDTPEIFTTKTVVTTDPYPGMFTSYENPRFPLVLGKGRVAEYYKHYENRRWSVKVSNSYNPQYLYSTIDIGNHDNVSDQEIPSSMPTRSHAYLLKLWTNFPTVVWDEDGLTLDGVTTTPAPAPEPEPEVPSIGGNFDAGSNFPYPLIQAFDVGSDQPYPVIYGLEVSS